MYDVITIGAATRDVFLLSDKFTFIHSKEFATGIGECVSFGTKLEVDKVVFTTGGGATNTAAIFANLGYSVAAVCRIGDDSAGREVLEDLKNHKIATVLTTKIKGGQTAYSTLLTAANGERTALVLRGVSADFSEKNIPWNKLKSHVIYLTSLGGDFTLSKKIIEKLKAVGCFVVWNPGKSELQKGLKNFRSVLPLVDIFNINREEAELLTNQNNLSKTFSLLARPKGITIITDGPKGAYAEKNGKIIYAQTTGIRSVSSTGAGDAFGSGLVAGLLKYDDLKKALSVGMINAESVIQKIGAKAGLLTSWPSEKQMNKIKIA
jgi:sugar/nucleoside kinase (ribokinase family)